MKPTRTAVLLAALMAGAATQAAAADKIVVGIIGQFSGPFAMSGRMYRQAIEAFMAEHGAAVGGREVEIVYRDVGGPNPAVSKRLAEELIVNDKAALLAGFFLSPDASAVASVVSETKTPTVLFNPASPPIIRQSPYFVRVGNTIWQDSVPAAEWAYGAGKRHAYIAVTDYAPGYDAQEAFKTEFTKLGGTVVGEDRMPINTVDYSPFVERIANAPADVVHVFVPSGAPQINFVKALAARGVIAKTPVIGLADDTDIPSFDDSTIGYNSISHYAPSLDTPANKKFQALLHEKFGTAVDPISFLQAAAFDGMQVVYRMIESQKGKTFDGAAAIQSVEGYSWEGPRGKITIEKTREITPNEYVQRIEKRDGKLTNVIVRTFEAVKDPWAAIHP